MTLMILLCRSTMRRNRNASPRWEELEGLLVGDVGKSCYHVHRIRVLRGIARSTSRGALWRSPSVGSHNFLTTHRRSVETTFFVMECSEKEKTVLIQRVMEMIVIRGYPFNMFQRMGMSLSPKLFLFAIYDLGLSNSCRVAV